MTRKNNPEIKPDKIDIIANFESIFYKNQKMVITAEQHKRSAIKNKYKMLNPTGENKTSKHNIRTTLFFLS